MLQNANPFNLVISFIVAILVFFLLGIRYVVTESQLIFKLWFISYGKVNITSIVSIKRSYSPLASNAGSLRRLYCELDDTRRYPFLLISPKNESRFLKLLKQLNQKIDIKVQTENEIRRIWTLDI
jgi:hypothetical protein